MYIKIESKKINQKVKIYIMPGTIKKIKINMNSKTSKI